MSTNCDIQLQKAVPLYRVVGAAIVDTYEDINRVQQIYSHWAARGLKQLNRKYLKQGGRKVLLSINRNTNTATLPPDFDEETFVGLIDGRGMKIPLRLRPDIVDLGNIEDIACEDKCEKCGQGIGACNELKISESTTLVVLNGNTYEQTVIKKMYPDGKFYIESIIPTWDIENETVVYKTQKQFVAAIDLKPCGCIENSTSNIEKIKKCRYDVYCGYYCDCCGTDNSYGGYRIFEESGLIQFDNVGSHTKVYMEYRGFMPKKNGQYQVPEVAFEALVAWTKFKSVENKRNIPLSERDWYWGRYVIAKDDMTKEIGRYSLSQIIQSISLTPKFDIYYPVCEQNSIVSPTEPISVPTTRVDECGVEETVCAPTAAKGFAAYSIAEIAGMGGSSPTVGLFTYQNDKLINAVGVNMIVVNNNNENIKVDFTLDTTTGTITRGSAWQDGDVLVVPTFYKLI